MDKNRKTTDITNNSYLQKKIEYLEKHNALLEKQLEDLSNDKATVEMQLMSYKKGLNVSIPATKKILKESLITIKMNKKLNKELTVKLNEVNNLLSQLKNTRVTYASKLSKSVDDILDNLKKNVK